MGLFPHTKTPEEQRFFDRLAGMKIELQPGMHVLDCLYPHRQEDGGRDCDFIIVTRQSSGTYAISEDFACKTGADAAYFVPKLTHFETFLMCLDIARQRGIESLYVPGYQDRVFPDRPEGEVRISNAADLWIRTEYQSRMIDALVEALNEC